MNRFRHLLPSILLALALTSVALADTITSSIQLLLMDSGSHSNDWGTQTNTNLQKIETAIAGVTTLNVTGGAVTMTADQARAAALVVTGSLSADTTLIVPSVPKIWVISNQASLGSFTLRIQTSGGSPITVPGTSTTTGIFWCDGINVILLSDQGGSLSSLTSLISTAQSTANSAYSLATAALPKAGGSMTGEVLLVNSTPSTSLAAASKGYVDSTAGASAMPTGAIMAFNLASCPTGWLLANGTSGTVDLRGEFVRGLDSGRGVDSGRTLASAQGDTIQNHTHNVSVPQSSGGGAGVGFVAGIPTGGYAAAVGGNMATGNAGTETRPRNVALLYCQKS